MPSNRAAAAYGRIATPKAPAKPNSPAARAAEKPVKWTVLLDRHTSRLFDRMASDAYDAAGQKVTKAALLRAMLEQMSEDEELRNAVARRAV